MPVEWANFRRKSIASSVAQVHGYPGASHLTKARRGRIPGEFLMGPIPLAWLTAATKLKGKAAIAVGLAIWFESGRRDSYKIRLTTKITDRFCVGKNAKSRGLKALEKAGLIRVDRKERRNPMVTILATEGWQISQLFPKQAS